jgi:hypothetical protein
MVCRVSVDDFHFQSVRIRLNDQPAYFGNWSGETDAEAPSDAPAESIFAAAEAGLASSRRLVVMPSIATRQLDDSENAMLVAFLLLKTTKTAQFLRTL